MTSKTPPLEKIDDLHWKIPKSYKNWMKVPVTVVASKKLLKLIKGDKTLEQISNVAGMPGIYKHAICMPDAHQGYGFPIGGVAALDREKGGISPGGVGYDINCGVRLIRTDLTKEEVSPKIKKIINKLFNHVPSGVGSEGKLTVNERELNNVLRKGARWAVEKGYGWEEDLERLEENGEMEEADPSVISSKAKGRGKPQLGSLGSGNHFLEVEYVGNILDEKVAKEFGIGKKNQVCIMIHTGSRGFGHQVCSDYLRKIEKAHRSTLHNLPDRELAYAPAGSELEKKYYKAMCAAANYAFCNRQMILHWTREVFEEVFDKSAEELGMHLVYGLCHNMAKKEEHEINGKKRKVYLHRKGATRAFPPGHEKIPKAYKKVGQPVIIPGNMGAGSYVLVGTEGGADTFYSTAHGSGRTMSRTAAKHKWWGGTVKKKLWEEEKIYVKSASGATIAEEAPGAYKDLKEVVRVSHEANIGKKVVKLNPLGVVKG